MFFLGDNDNDCINTFILMYESMIYQLKGFYRYIKTKIAFSNYETHNIGIIGKI
jgi:hypothetical protein